MKTQLTLLKGALSAWVLGIICMKATGQSVVESTAAGGAWQLASTWVGGVVPGASDHVVINGPVTFCYGYTWNSVSAAQLTINSGGSLTGCGEIHISGSVINYGNIHDSGGTYDFNVGGNVSNYGTWTHRHLFFTGTSQNLYQAPGSVMDLTGYWQIQNAACTLTATSPITFKDTWYLGGATLNMNGHELYLLNPARLQNSYPHPTSYLVNVRDVYFKTSVTPNSGELGLTDLTITCDTMIIHNHGRAANITVNGNVLVKDTLTTIGSQSNAVSISGALINEGYVFHTPYYMSTNYFYLSGDLINKGYFKPSRVFFNGTGIQNMYCDGNKYIDSEYQMEVSSNSVQLNATSPLYVNGKFYGLYNNLTTLNLNGHGLYLGPQALVDQFNFQNAKLFKGLNGSKFQGSNNFYGDTLRIQGKLQVNYSPSFYCNILVEDSLLTTDPNIHGSLINNGYFSGSWVTCYGSVLNNGGLICTYLRLNGNQPRTFQCSGVSASIRMQDTIKLVGYNVVPNLSTWGSTYNEWAVVMPGATLEFLAPSGLWQITNYGTVLWQQSINGASSNSYDFFKSQLKNKVGTQVQSIRVEVSEHQAPFGLANAATMRWKLLNFPRLYEDTLQQLKLWYDPGQLNGIPEDSLKLFFSNDGGLSWKRITAGVSVSASQNLVTAHNVPSVGYYILAGSPVGISLLPPAASQVIPDKSGNQGSVLVQVLGQGLQGATQVKLIQNGSGTTIPSSSLLAADPGGEVVKALFSFTGQPLGFYDVQVVLPGGNSVTIPSGFKLEAAVPPQVDVYLLGRPNIRPNSWQYYTIAFTNRGNVDARAVPVFLTITDKPGTQMEFVDFQLNPDSGLFQGVYGSVLDTMPLFYKADSALFDKNDVLIYPMYIPVVPAGATGSVRFRVRTTEAISLQVSAQSPLFVNPFNVNMANCMIGVLASGVFDATMGAIPGVGCITSVANNWFATYAMADQSGNTWKDWGSLTLGWAATFLDCGVNLSGIGALMKATTIFLLNMKGYADAFADCRDGKPAAINLWVVIAMDPNDKAGPAGFTSSGYMAYPERMNYMINFENLPSATAPAQRVYVKDSLDISKVDMQTFRFGTVGFGDRIIEVATHAHTFTEYVDLRPQVDVIVKVEGVAHTATGVVEWTLTSLDPMSLVEVDDPLLGFLPPNINAPEGQGFITFSVKPQGNLTHNTTLDNKASIVFDQNPAIQTNTWHNTLDLIPPSGTISGHQLLNDTTVLLQWPNALDNGSGIREYYLYISENNGPYKLYYTGNAAKQAVFVGKLNHTYRFNICGVDSVGNIQPQASSPDLTVTFQHVGDAGTEEVQVNLFPNPSEGWLNIITDHLGEVQWEIWSVQGQLLKRGRLNSGSNVLAIQELPSGAYLLKIIAGETTPTRVYRFIKK
jgi:hypothetical protein